VLTLNLLAIELLLVEQQGGINSLHVSTLGDGHIVSDGNFLKTQFWLKLTSISMSTKNSLTSSLPVSGLRLLTLMISESPQSRSRLREREPVLLSSFLLIVKVVRVVSVN
jgi:hypothetical protein